MRKKHKTTAGLDEAGRGPLAGPVVACAVAVLRRTVLRKLRRTVLRNLRDSKKLSPKKREKFFKILTNHPAEGEARQGRPAIEWGMGRISEKVIDKINILEATKLAMEKALVNLEKKMSKVRPYSRFYSIGYLILDGKMSLNLEIPQKSIVKADEKIFSCMAASIIAKVTRDRMMGKYHKRYPQYGFNRHKGYPTKFHYRMLKRYGPCQIHRKSFNINII